MSDILVVVEHLRGEVRDVTFEMLARAGELSAATGGKVSALLLGGPGTGLAARVEHYCDRLLTREHADLADFNSEVYQQAVADVIAEEKPGLVMLAHSALGVDLAPSLAMQTGLPLVSDCIGIAHDAGGFLLTRQMYAGKLNADWRFKGPAGMVTVRAGAFKPGEARASGAELKAGAWAPRAGLKRKFLGYEEAPSTGVDITKATVIVAVGRGIKDQKNMPMVEAFAKSIGAELGCSRPVIDAGWLTKDRQIGSSGKTVKPKLYVGLGISGAFQHTAGIKGVETIIAVNKDANAPIFAMAHYGIVGDIMKVLPALEARIREMRGV